MFQFENKIVFIISLEHWGGMKLSKHHYAMELAKNNCRVFFIESPRPSNKDVTIESCDDHPNIKIVKYKPVYRGKRFLPRFIFNRLLQYQIKLLLKTIGVKPDVVWSFQGYLLGNLQLFGAPVTIFFAADSFSETKLPREIYSADILFGVSDTIYNRIKESGKPTFQINHGLQREFVESAQRLSGAEMKVVSNKNISVGYSGNLRMEALDRQTMMKVIRNNPEIKFVFWGTYSKYGSNLGVAFKDKEVDEFIDFLENSGNVQLRGVVSSKQLQQEMIEMDMFWICWNLQLSTFWDGSNSHKILEYLSTGKPVVSHYVSSYKNNNMLYMLSTKDNLEYELLFNDIVNKIKTGESAEVIKRRLSFAINNSYQSQLKFIEDKINTLH
jgi:hypothetical protein